MTEKEVRQLLAMTQAVYPNYNPPSREAAVNAWLLCLSEYDNSLVMAAFKAYMTTNTSGFAPAPGQLIEILQTLTQPSELNELEAWSIVRKALRNCGYNAEQEFAKLPTVVQKTVGTPQQLKIWACDSEFNENVVSSNFIKTYRTEVKRATELNKMPSEIKKLVKRVNENSVSAQIASEDTISIEIVKQGVSDDVCEWKLCDEEANVYDTSCRNPHILIEGTPRENNYEFCPYCGKKIKVVE